MLNKFRSCGAVTLRSVHKSLVHDYARLVHDTDMGKLTVQLANDWYDLTEPLPIPTDLPAQRRPYGLLKRG